MVDGYFKTENFLSMIPIIAVCSLNYLTMNIFYYIEKRKSIVFGKIFNFLFKNFS